MYIVFQSFDIKLCLTTPGLYDTTQSIVDGNMGDEGEEHM